MIAALKPWGWPGALGAALLVAAGGCALLGARFDREAATLQADTRALRARAVPVAAAPRQQSVQQWQAALPAAAERQQRLADLLELSARLDLPSARTEHRLSSADGLERLRITQPVAGNYAQLRRYLSAALAHDPALSLDALKLRRPSPLSTEVEAELSWSLHGRAP